MDLHDLISCLSFLKTLLIVECCSSIMLVGDVMYFKENLRSLRHLNRESQDDLAEFLGYKSFTTIQKWEDGTSIPSMPVIKKIADHYDIPLDVFCNENLTEIMVPQKKVPIVGTVKTGYGLLAYQNISGYEFVPEIDTGSGVYFYLDVVGDSMKNVRILEGDRVYCRQQDSLENGDIGVILLENDEVTLKRVFFKKNKMILKPENDNMEQVEYSDEEIQQKGIKILGKLIHNKIFY